MKFVDPTPEGEALYELLLQAPRLNRLVQSLTAGQGPHWTIGLWMLLRSINVDGPRTVPQIARALGLARQRIQKIVDEAETGGVVSRQTNPDHKRSQIVALTRGGTAKLSRIECEMRLVAQEMADAFDIRDLDAALRVLISLQASLDARRR